VLELTKQTGQLLARSVKEARRLAAAARGKARGRGAQAKLKAARKLEELADRCERVVEQITKRVKGEKITDRGRHTFCVSAVVKVTVTLSCVNE